MLSIETHPTSRYCLADDGETLIIYGGRITNGATTLSISPELFILNLTSMVWTLGNESAAARIYAVCTIYNGTFLSWGGKLCMDVLLLLDVFFSIEYTCAEKPFIDNMTPCYGFALGSDAQSTVNEPVIVYNIKSDQYLNKYTVQPSPDLSASPKNEGKSGSNSGSSNRFSKGAIVGIFLGAALGTAFLVWGVRYSMEKRDRLKKGGTNDEGASGNTINTRNPYRRGYRLPHSHAPHEHPPTSQNAPQNFSNDLPGFMMDHATRGPEGAPYGGHGNAGDTHFEDLGSWRDRQWNMTSVGSPHRLLESETLRSTQR
jgi:hypothetical protein